MRIRFIEGTFESIEGLTGAYYIYNGFRHSVAGLMTYTGGDNENVFYCKKVTEKLTGNTIYVVKQKKIITTIFIFLHELSHWVVYKLCKKNGIRYHKWIDKHLK